MIKIYLYNNKAEVLKEDTDSYLAMKSLLTFTESEVRKTKSGQYKQERKKVRLYQDMGDRIVFLRGIVDLTPQNKYVIIDKTYENEIPEVHIDKEEIKTILQPESGFDLRKDQIMAVRKILKLRWGTLQMATGAGKTEVLAAILRYLHKKLNYYPKTLLIEPTLKLVESTTERFNSYKIPASIYTEHRNINESEVIVSHPQSLNNDMLEDPSLLDNVKIVMFDESHHGQADTWKKLIHSLRNIEFSVGTSASVVKNVNAEIDEMTPEEILAIGCTGNVVMDTPPSFYVDKGFLAESIVFRVENRADEDIWDNKDWAGEIYPQKINSKVRNDKIRLISRFFALNDRKVLILVDRKAHAEAIMNGLVLSDISHLAGICYGSNVNKKYSLEMEELIKTDEDVLRQFKDGEIRILLATSHLDEGVDVPDLDVLILGGGGKNQRRLIQRLGRMLRKTKKGKYGYVIDFTDYKSDILRKHSKIRRKIYKEKIGISEDRIYDNIKIEELIHIFKDAENIDVRRN